MESGCRPANLWWAAMAAGSVLALACVAAAAGPGAGQGPEVVSAAAPPRPEAPVKVEFPVKIEFPVKHEQVDGFVLRGPGQPNDECMNVLPLAVPGMTWGSTVGANASPEANACPGYGLFSPGVWYDFVGNGGVVTLETCGGADWDTFLRVFTGVCADLTCIGQNDDACDVQSRITFPTLWGTRYRVYVSGFNWDEGPFVLSASVVGGAPPNDECSSAFTLPVPGATSGSTTGGTPSPEAGACQDVGGLASPGTWYSFVGVGGAVTIHTCTTTTWDTVLRVFTGECGTLTCVAQNDDFCDLQSLVAFTTVPGVLYRVYLSGFGGDHGSFTLMSSIESLPNDHCTSAIPVPAPGTRQGTTVGASPSPEASVCAGPGLVSPGVWYRFLGDGGLMRIHTCGSDWDTVLRVFTGDCGSLACVDVNDDFCDLQSSITVLTQAGADYFVYVSGFADADGPFTLHIELDAPPNNGCADSIAMMVPGSADGTTVGAAPSPEAAPCPGFGLVSPGVWYHFTGNGVTARFQTCGAAAWDTVLRAFTGDCGSLTCVAMNDDACSLQSMITFPTVPGTVYRVYLSGFGSEQGPFTLTADYIAPPNDECAASTPLAVPGSTLGTTHAASPSPQAAACDGFGLDSPGAWYHFTGTGAQVTIDTCGTASWDTVLRAFTGPCGGLTCVAINDDACSSLQSSISFPTVAGTTYRIYISGFAGAVGHFRLNASSGSSDDCNNNGIPDAQEIASNPALDCFNPAVLQSPLSIGGPDGIIDACQCPANWNRDAQVNSTDISAYITSWLAAVNAGTLIADINCSGAVNSTDISAYITIWLSAVNHTVPYDNCP